MPKDQITYSFIERFGDLLAYCLLSIGAALVRLLVRPGKTFRDSLITFLGGIVFGVIVGYLIRDTPWLSKYANGIVAIAAMIGKEIFTVLIQTAPKALGNALVLWLTHSIPTIKKDDTKDDPATGDN